MTGRLCWASHVPCCGRHRRPSGSFTGSVWQSRRWVLRPVPVTVLRALTDTWEPRLWVQATQATRAACPAQVLPPPMSTPLPPGLGSNRSPSSGPRGGRHLRRDSSPSVPGGEAAAGISEASLRLVYANLPQMSCCFLLIFEVYSPSCPSEPSRLWSRQNAVQDGLVFLPFVLSESTRATSHANPTAGGAASPSNGRGAPTAPRRSTTRFRGSASGCACAQTPPRHLPRGPLIPLSIT